MKVAVQSEVDENIPASARYTLTLLFLASALNLFDRQIINVLGQDIKLDLGLSDFELGLLNGAAFGLFYSILGIPLAYLADRTNRVQLISVSIALWSLLTAACGMAANFFQLVCYRMGVGIGEAGCAPASAAIIADYFPPERRSSAMGILFLGVPIGGFLGLAVGGYVGEIYGWRIAFFIAGVPGIALSLLIFLTLRDKRTSSSNLLVREESLKSGLQLLNNSAYLWLLVGGALASSLIYAAGAWMPVYLIRSHGLSTSEVGLYIGLAVGAGGSLGAVGGGIAADWIRRSFGHSEIIVPCVSSMVAGIALLCAVAVEGLGLIISFFVLFNIAAFSWMGPAIAKVQSVAHSSVRALSVGVHVAVANIFSLIFFVPFVGFLSDLFSSKEPSSLAWALGIAAIAGPVGALAYFRVDKCVRSQKLGLSSPELS